MIRSVAAVAFIACSVALASPGANAGPTLSDESLGMTCRYYVLGARLSWARFGGDWVDRAGNAFGDEAFSTASLQGAVDGTDVHWDVSSLAQLWMEGKYLPGALLVRQASGSRNWSTDFHSRESSEEGKRPVLTVVWDDGTSHRVAPLADSHLSCATHRSLGGSSFLRIGPDTPAVLVFPFPAKLPGLRSLQRATLSLSTIRPKGNTVYGVFALAPPFVDSPETLASIATRYPGDRGIQLDESVLFATGFEEPDWQKPWSFIDKSSAARPIMGDDGNGFVAFDGNALKVTVREGRTLGLSMHYPFLRGLGAEPEELYFRYHLRFGDDWKPVVDGGKLTGFSGTYDRAGWGSRRSNGVNGWSARGRFEKQRPGTMLENLVAVGSYVYHADMRDTTGDAWGWNRGPTGLLERNRWYSVEQYVRLNDPQTSNGILRAWIDGQLAFEKTDIRFRTDAALRIESLWMNVYHGGTAPSQRDMSLYIDNVVIARRYIGPTAK